MSTGGGAAAGAAGAAGVGGDGAGLASNGNGNSGDALTNGHQQQGQSFDPGQIAEMLQGLQGSQEQLRQQFSDFIGQSGEDDGGEYDDGEYDTGDLPPEVAQVAEENGWQWGGEMSAEEAAELGLDGDGEEAGDPSDPATMANVLGDAFADYIRGELQPLQQEVAEARRETQEAKLEAEYRQLAAEFPDLGDRDTMEEVLSVARDFATARGLPAKMAADPALLRLVYMAGVAAEVAQAEAGMEDPGAAHLEGGAGSSPSGGRASAADMIVNPQLAGGAQGSHVLPFQ